jgi:hypothetical protein
MWLANQVALHSMWTYGVGILGNTAMSETSSLPSYMSATDYSWS